MFYRKKPVVIEARQLTTDNIKEIYEWVYDRTVVLQTQFAHERWEDYCTHVSIEGMYISTLEDGKNGQVKHVASIGDYIIKGVKGEFYACKPDIFELTYEAVEKNGVLSDTELIDWLEKNLFVKGWNGVVGTGAKTNWRLDEGSWRHKVANMNGETFRDALRAAIAKEQT